MRKYRFVHPRALPTRQSESAVWFKAGAVVEHDDLHPGHRASLVRQGVLVELPEEEVVLAQASVPETIATDANGRILNEGLTETEGTSNGDENAENAEASGEEGDSGEDVGTPEEPAPKKPARRSRRRVEE